MLRLCIEAVPECSEITLAERAEVELRILAFRAEPSPASDASTTERRRGRALPTFILCLSGHAVGWPGRSTSATRRDSPPVDCVPPTRMALRSQEDLPSPGWRSSQRNRSTVRWSATYRAPHAPTSPDPVSRIHLVSEGASPPNATRGSMVVAACHRRYRCHSTYPLHACVQSR